MPKFLGLDLGSNSIGWAIRDTSIADDERQIMRFGVKLFEEGIKLEKSIPSSKANERTLKRSMRRNNYRRKLRKFKVLKLLIENSMCPLSIEELNNWIKPIRKRLAKYPNSDEFRRWLALDFNYDGESEYQNPYELRAKASNNQLSLMELGRIFYHLSQRRGFLSNRKVDNIADDEGNEKANELGKVMSAIKELESQLNESETYGQHFANYDTHRERIRGRFLDRKKLVEEFELIVKANKIDDDLAAKLKKEIFHQRPLKSQKHNIGYCTLEPRRHRCPISHFYFEEFRMLQFINSIKYKDISKAEELFKDEQSNTLVPLSQEHRDLIMPLFFRVSKSSFKFKEIKEKINKATKNKYYFKYNDNTTVSGCPSTAKIISAIGEDKWNSLKDENIKGNYQENANEAGKGEISKEDVWNVLFSFDDKEKIAEWGIKWLNLSEEQVNKFANINLQQGYAALSKNAIKKIMLYLRKGFIYSYSVFMANLDKVLGYDIFENEKETIGKEIENIIAASSKYSKMVQIANSLVTKHLEYYDDKTYKFPESEVYQLKNRISEAISNEFTDSLLDDLKYLYVDFYIQLNNQIFGNSINYLVPKRIETIIKDYLASKFNLSSEALKHLYHPSAIDNFKLVEGEDSNLYLDKPFLKSIKNPVLNRALFQIYQLINYLIKNGDIDSDTRVHIEFGRELNSINMRMAYQNWQKKREDKRSKANDEIKKLYYEETKKEITPTETDVLKYLLWEEQGRKCFYTDKQIGIADLINGEKFDIEHTLPRSLTLDNSQENKTICCSHFNRNIKQNSLPIQLPNYNKTAVIGGITYPSIIDNIEKAYNRTLESLKSKLQGLKNSTSGASIRLKNELIFDIKYYNGKIRRFETKEIPDGFKVSQGVDISIINRYAAEMLKSYFNRVVVFQSRILKDVKDYWEIDINKATATDNNDLKKDRSYHHHHAVDAICLTFLRKEVYDKLANYYRSKDEKWQKEQKLTEKLPFDNFHDFIHNIRSNIIINHQRKDYAFNQTKKIIRKKGKIDYTKIIENGKTIKKIKYAKGNGVRLPLHQESNYGAILQDDGIKYVIRKALNDANFKNLDDLNKIVDPAVRKVVIETIRNSMANGSTFKDAINQDIYMNREKNIRINKVRCITRETNPIRLKKHLLTSESIQREHKQYIYVKNDGNYLVVIYDKYKNNKFERDSYVYSNLEIAQ